jgi:hypothetical protein
MLIQITQISHIPLPEEIDKMNMFCQFCATEKKELRRLPHTKDPDSGVSIICRECYQRMELPFRTTQNMSLPPQTRFPTPKFEELEKC